MRLLLIRHALPARNETHIDPELDDTGHRQVAALASLLGDERIDTVWSSPLRRAVQTAQPLAAARGLGIRTHPGLVEFDFGHGMYIPGEETSHPAVQDMTRRIENQEGDVELLAFRDTVAAAVTEVIASATPEDTVAVACHGGVVNAYASAVLGAREVMFANVLYASVTTFTVSRRGRVRLLAFNEHQHIRDLDRAAGS